MLFEAYVLPVTLAYAGLALVGVALAVIDARTHRLPNRLVLPLYPGMIALFACACLLGAPWSSLARALVSGAALFAFYLVLWRTGGGMGGGDVKLAGVLGIALGWMGWEALALGALAGFVLGGLYSAVVLALRRADRNSRVPFGPFMLTGAALGIVAGVVA